MLGEAGEGDVGVCGEGVVEGVQGGEGEDGRCREEEVWGVPFVEVRGELRWIAV